MGRDARPGFKEWPTMRVGGLSPSGCLLSSKDRSARNRTILQETPRASVRVAACRWAGVAAGRVGGTTAGWPQLAVRTPLRRCETGAVKGGPQAERGPKRSAGPQRPLTAYLIAH